MPLAQQIDGGRLAERAESREQSANTRAAKNMREQDDLDLKELVDSFGTDQAFEVKLIRRKPKMWNGVHIEGHLETFDEWLPEEEIAEMYGGGTYTVKICKPNAKGSMVYFKSGTLKLPGPPKGPGIKEEDEDKDGNVVFSHPSSYEDPSVVSQAISTLQGIIENQKGSGMDPVLLQAITAPMQMQIAQMQTTQQAAQQRMEAKDDKIMELMSTKPDVPDTSSSDRLMDKMFDSSNSRQESMRMMHESEIRMMRENNRDDIKRIEDRYERQMHAMQEAHKREIDNLSRTSDMMNSANKIGYESQVSSYKMEADRLRMDLTEARAEIAALRAKKEKTLIEQASELHQVGEKLSSLGLGGFGKDEDEKEHWAERLIGGVMDNPEIVSTVAQGLSNVQNATPPAPPPGAVTPPQQQDQQATQQQATQQPQPGQAQLPAGQQQEPVHVDDIPIGQPFYGPDGETYVKVPPDGSIVTYAQAVEMAKREEAETQAAKEEAEGKPSPAQIKIAVTFAEGAYQNGTPPEVFAQTARNSVPGDLLDHISEVGVDTFLNEEANLEHGSPLRTQAGRNYMRQVAEFLVGDEVS